jgi:RNA polymerase sigma-70 factor (ECF subfamily)
MDETSAKREQRFTRLYDACYSPVRAYAWRREPDMADDVVAETFTIAWQDLDRVPAEPLPWLLGVARNVLRNLRRSERRRREREARVASDVIPSPAGALEQSSPLASALRRLPERDREILLLVAWEDLDRVDLAVALGCSRATAAVRLFRARRRLAAMIGRPGPSIRAVPADSEGGLVDDC